MRIIKVLLYCDLPSLWNSFAALYISLLQDSRFDVTVLAMPELYNGKFKNYDIIDFFDQNGIAYIKGYDVLKKVTLKIPDYVFAFYAEVGNKAGSLPAEKVMADALFELAGELSLNAIDKQQRMSE